MSNFKNNQNINKEDATGSTNLLVIRDWVTPYSGNLKGNYAPAEYWASKLGKTVDEFLSDFKSGNLDTWFVIY